MLAENTMRLNQEAKNLLSVMALVAALALTLNDAAAGGDDRNMLSWSLALFGVAILLWLWVRRDATKAHDEAVEAAADEAESAGENLTRINGIGPRYAQILQAAGIKSYAQIAALSLNELAQVFADADVNRPPGLEGWLEQAALAARGDWDGLAAWQDAQ